jgi:hypothetical protein
VDWGGGLKALAAWQAARGIPSLVVVPFDLDPFPGGAIPPLDEPPTYHAMTHLATYGVTGRVRNGAVLFLPIERTVYAVSGHALARAYALDRERLRALGEPSAVVGGFFIFDRR